MANADSSTGKSNQNTSDRHPWQPAGPAPAVKMPTDNTKTPSAGSQLPAPKGYGY